MPYIFWRTTNPEVATVDLKGLVTLQSSANTESNGNFDMCYIIAESLYADGPVVNVEVNNVGNSENIIFESKGGNEIDFNAPVEIYTINGIRLNSPVSSLASGLYIIRQGKNVKKITIK